MCQRGLLDAATTTRSMRTIAVAPSTVFSYSHRPMCQGFAEGNIEHLPVAALWQLITCRYAHIIKDCNRAFS